MNGISAFYILIACVCMHVCYMWRSTHSDLKRVWALLELELEAINHLMWVLEGEPRFSGKETNTPSH